MFVFRPGVLDNAPQMMIAPLKGPESAAERARFQHDLVQRFPNVSAIDLREMLQTVRDVMNKVTLAISIVGGLVLLSGVLILIGAVAMTKFQRVYEAAVFKTLGANTRTIARMLLLEYSVLGLLAGIDRVGRRGGAHLGHQPLRDRHPVAGLSRSSTPGRADHDGPGRRHRGALEPRRPQAQAARDAARGVDVELPRTAAFNCSRTGQPSRPRPSPD